VLDLDSPRVGRFSEADQVGLERLAAIFLDLSDV
jgi:L-methionine (R)-S-oxide reductase